MPTLPPIWNIPYRPNPFFTGREDILSRLHNTLITGQPAALTQPQAISGLGGIGKTQTAIEYAHRYGSEYQAVFWAKADSREVLISDFVSIADVLNLPEKNEQDQNRIVNAVKRWLQNNRGWLLVLDNVDDLVIVDDFIPPRGGGHVLLTTRIQATGSIASSIEIDQMEPEEGALFLLRRAKLIDEATSEDQSKAKEISEVMDGLPLALDQAGAFIEQTNCSLSHYRNLYRDQRIELLKRRGKFTSGHPESVVTTLWSSFKRVAKANPVTIKILHLCAFLHPDDIPEEIIALVISDPEDIFQPIATNLLSLEDAIGELFDYSLIKRNSQTRTVSIHRLVQEVIKDEMDEDGQRAWATYIVSIIHRVFPRGQDKKWLNDCQRYSQHTIKCFELIERWDIVAFEAAQLLENLAQYLYPTIGFSTRFEDLNLIEKIHLRILIILEEIVGIDHLCIAHCLAKLAFIYALQGQLEKIEVSHRQAQSICANGVGFEHPEVKKILTAFSLAQQVSIELKEQSI